VVKARTPSQQAVRVGDRTGLSLDARTLTLFDAATGRALPSAGNRGAARHG
jgi:multiple sugar transport system ATP-binding protein